MDKFLLITDLEGITGVESFEDMQPSGEKNQEAKEILTGDVNCVIKSILDYGRESNTKCEIHIIDGHGSGGLVKEKIMHEIPRLLPTVPIAMTKQ